MRRAAAGGRRGDVLAVVARRAADDQLLVLARSVRRQTRRPVAAEYAVLVEDGSSSRLVVQRRVLVAAHRHRRQRDHLLYVQCRFQHLRLRGRPVWEEAGSLKVGRFCQLGYMYKHAVTNIKSLYFSYHDVHLHSPKISFGEAGTGSSEGSYL